MANPFCAGSVEKNPSPATGLVLLVQRSRALSAPAAGSPSWVG